MSRHDLPPERSADAADGTDFRGSLFSPIRAIREIRG